MSGSVFVDSNVLVYSRDASEPVKQAKAMNLLSGLWEARSGRLSTQVCNEYYVTVTRKLKPGMDHDDAWRDLESLFAWNPLPINREVLVKARETQARYGLSWWDSLIVSAAFHLGCATIASEDLGSDQEYFGVVVRNPFA